MIDKYIDYANAFGASDEVLNWIRTTLNKGLTKKVVISQDEIEHVLDYLCSDKAPKRLMKMSITQAKSNTAKWVKTNQKKGRNLVDSDKDIKSIHDFSDGSRIVELLTNKAFKREGFLMSHCLGGYSVDSDKKIYSYRDTKNIPHATFEVVRNNNEVMQIKGKGNGEIHPKYIDPILTFLASIDQAPRPSEMKNLGYYHINKESYALVKAIKGYENQVTYIHGEMYAY